MAVSTKMAVFWVAAPYSLVEVYQYFRSPCCLHHQGDGTVNFYQITRHYNPEDSHLQFLSSPTQLHLFSWMVLIFRIGQTTLLHSTDSLSTNIVIGVIFLCFCCCLFGKLTTINCDWV
jgi:hypothetical protein